MKDCVSCVHEYLSPMSDTCRECGIAMLNYEEAKPKPITNADRLRAMSDEELAMLIHDIVQAEMWRAQVRECITAETGWLDWLKKEVDDGQTP